MIWHLQIASRAKKALEKLPAKDQRLIVSGLEAMRTDPFSGNIKRLQNERSAWRRRVGSYRIFFDANPETFTVDVVEIARRTSTTY